MYTPTYYVHYAPFPTCVNGATVPNDDGTFDIYINAILPEERQRDALRHEVRHLVGDHFYDDTRTIRQIETEANISA